MLWKRLETVGEGRTRVSLYVNDTGRGISALLVGGDSPHVGGVVLASPRCSLAKSENVSCDVSSITLPGHLDNKIGSTVAQILCTSLECVVSLACGIHVEGATYEELVSVQKHCKQAALQVLEARVRAGL